MINGVAFPAPEPHVTFAFARFSFAAALLLLLPSAAQAQAPRQVRDLDADWHFSLGDQHGAEQTDFNDAAWTRLSVPHDWSIAGPVDKSNPSGQGGGYFPNGIGWYRRELALPAADEHRHVFVVFDGVMANSDVWINGFHLGHRPNGYVSQVYELTGHVQFGATAHNVLAVRCDNAQQPASRWYEGGGIYRPVRLVVTNDVHIEPWGTVVRTPAVTEASATMQVQTLVTNDSATPANVSLHVTLRLPSGSALRTSAPMVSKPLTIAPHSSATLQIAFTVPHPDRWDIEHPAMHLVHAVIQRDGKAVDAEDVPFGIREFHFDADTGFWLNGRNFKIKGTAIHGDGGGVGIAVPAAVYEHRLRALKALGVNAIRTAHNPPAPEFLDACDRLGLLVMDEMFDQWTVAKNPYDYHLFFKEWAVRDTDDTVLRDRNHPSIILWSAGNEIHDTPQTALANKILTSLVATFHANDPTRPVTQALFRPNVSHDYDNGLADLLDVVGQNYRENELLAAHTSKPTRKIIGTENGHDRPIWLAMRDNAPYSGQFLWAGIDYLGEAGEAGGWPLIGNAAGLLDRTGVPRARGYERESWWLAKPNVHAARRVAASEKLSVDPGYENAPARFKQVLYLDWNPENPGPHTETVEVYTNCEEVELVLNGTSLGKQTIHADASPLSWKVPYAAGSLKAVARNAGKVVAEDELRTAGPATHIELRPERASVSPAASDAVYVEASVRDAAGVMVPGASTLMHFSTTGPGAILAVDNGSNADHDSFVLPQRRAYEGRAVFLVRATAASGTIHVKATADGLTAGSADVTATAPPVTPARSF